MDEQSANAIQREINPPPHEELVAELRDPLAFIPAAELDVQRKQRRRRAAIKLAIAIGVPVFIVVFDKLVFPHGAGCRSGGLLDLSGTRCSKNALGGIVGVLFLVALGLRGLYDLMTVDKAIADVKRWGLLAIHPELRDAEAELQKTRKVNPWPKRVIWFVVTLPITYTILFYIALWLKLIRVDQ